MHRTWAGTTGKPARVARCFSCSRVTASAVLLAAVALLVALSTLAACAMPGGSTTAGSTTPPAAGSPTTQTAHPTATPTPPATTSTSGPSGTVNVQWQPGSLMTEFNLKGLTASTLTLGFIVPGTCADPGGTATFRSKAAVTDANGSVSGESSTLGVLPSGVRLPKAVDVVQKGQVVLCGDTTGMPSTYPAGSGNNPSGSATITLHPASGPAPKQAHR
jgi:hypothetical protein